MQIEHISANYYRTGDGELVKMGRPMVVVYSLEFDFTVKTKTETFELGKRYCFSCIVDTLSDMKDDILSDLLWRFDCYDENDDELSISMRGIKEKSIRIELKYEI